jgi:hypothetical protein
MGAPTLRGFGEPGLSGECMSPSKRYIPPVVTPFCFSLKAIAMGVGSVGIAGSLPFVSLGLNWELKGVFGDMSEPSSMLETERLRLFMFFKLDDEKFFRSPVLDCTRPGDPERGNCPFSLSFVKVCVSVGVGGRMTSDGLGPGKGDEACRAD